MKRHIFNINLLMFIFILSACSDPIFFHIQGETEIKPPFIAGSPTNFIKFNSSIYVAGGYEDNKDLKNRLFRYFEVTTGKWEWKVIDPKGLIISLAATNSTLYAIFEKDGIGVLKQTSDPENNDFFPIQKITGNVQAVYTSNDKLFYCIRNSDDGTYEIFHFDGSTNTKLILGKTGDKDTKAFLVGVVHDGSDYYICTNGGIYTTDDLTTTPVLIQGTSLRTDYSTYFIGIIYLNPSLTAAITRNGELLNVKTTGLTSLKNINSANDTKRFLATGALAEWTDGTSNLLLAGRKDSTPSTNTGFSFGYVEIEYDSAGDVVGSFSSPGASSLTTVSSTESFSSTIGVNPINHLIQAQDGTIFASTQSKGVWDCRLRSNGWEWNSALQDPNPK